MLIIPTTSWAEVAQAFREAPKELAASNQTWSMVKWAILVAQEVAKMEKPKG